MAELKKCPFNGFKPCVGNECAFFLGPIYAKGAFFNNDLMIDPRDISFPCSLSVVGKVAFLSHQPQAKEMEK